jgi:peptidoglycan/xylan/chitin deacetylase (PgdA/CDA1 family)
VAAGLRSALVHGVAAGLAGARLLPPLARLAGRARGPAAFPVLTFHRVNDEGDPFFPALPTAVFEGWMAHLARAYRVLPLEDLVERMRRGGLPRHAIALTFDDGYRDNLTHAAPVLARLGLPATLFLATGFIGTAEVPWFDRLAMALKKTGAREVAAPGGERLPLGSAAERLAALDRLLAELKRLPDEALHAALDRLLRALGLTDQRCFKNWMLTWDDVHALRGLGWRLGAHTVNHPILSRVSPERAWKEILGSRTMIESACGVAPACFAYPNGGPGDYTETVKALVREAGFACAVTTRFGLNTAATSPWELRRGGPWEAHAPTWALKLAWYRLRRP